MSSSESDEDNLDLIKEALDTQFVVEDLYNIEKKTDKNVESTERPILNHETFEKAPSLRRNAHKEDEEFNFFRVTPEFQDYVSKQLCKIIEKKLKKLVEENTSPIKPKKKLKNRVRLLKTSENYVTDLQEHCDYNSLVVKKCRSFKRKIDAEDNITEAERCKLSAVNPIDVINKTEIRCWSSRTKAEVFEYKKDSNGVLIYQAPKFV